MRCKICDWSPTAGSVYRGSVHLHGSVDRVKYLQVLPDESCICSQCIQAEKEVLKLYKKEEIAKKEGLIEESQKEPHPMSVWKVK